MGRRTGFREAETSGADAKVLGPALSEEAIVAHRGTLRAEELQAASFSLGLLVVGQSGKVSRTDYCYGC